MALAGCFGCFNSSTVKCLLQAIPHVSCSQAARAGAGAGTQDAGAEGESGMGGPDTTSFRQWFLIYPTW